MKTLKLIVNLEEKTVRTEGSNHALKGNVDGVMNFYEAGIEGLTDKDDIEEALIDINDVEYDKVIVEFESFDFNKNFSCDVEIKDLEELGWEFDSTYEAVAAAQNITEEEAKVYENENYHIEITVDDQGKTFCRTVNTQKKSTGIDEGSDNEATGDDEQTIKDLIQLHSEGKLWNEKNFIT